MNTEVTIPDQAEMIRHYKGRLKKMQAAQRDSHGNVRIDVDAQVAQRQLMETLEQLISSSLKTCRTSVVIGVRTSQPVQSHRDLAEQERILADRRHKVLYTVMQMNGSRGLQEDLAKRRLWPSPGGRHIVEPPESGVHNSGLWWKPWYRLRNIMRTPWSGWGRSKENQGAFRWGVQPQQFEMRPVWGANSSH